MSSFVYALGIFILFFVLVYGHYATFAWTVCKPLGSLSIISARASLGSSTFTHGYLRSTISFVSFLLSTGISIFTFEHSFLSQLTHIVRNCIPDVEAEDVRENEREYGDKHSAVIHMDSM